MPESATLFIIERAIRDASRLNRLLDRSGTGNSVLFIQDSVYTLRTGSMATNLVARCVETNTVYALLPDLKARGFGENEIISGITLLDYPGFVDLTVIHTKINRWL